MMFACTAYFLYTDKKKAAIKFNAKKKNCCSFPVYTVCFPLFRCNFPQSIIDDNERCTGTLNIISINRDVLVGIPTWPGLLLEDNRSARTVSHAIEIRKQFCRMFLWRILSGKAWLYGPRTPKLGFLELPAAFV